MPYAKSIMDYIFRWMGAKFLGPEYAVSEAGETARCGRRSRIRRSQLPFNAMSTDAPSVLGMRVDHDAQWELL